MLLKWPCLDETPHYLWIYTRMFQTLQLVVTLVKSKIENRDISYIIHLYYYLPREIMILTDVSWLPLSSLQRKSFICSMWKTSQLYILIRNPLWDFLMWSIKKISLRVGQINYACLISIFNIF